MPFSTFFSCSLFSYIQGVGKVPVLLLWVLLLACFQVQQLHVYDFIWRAGLMWKCFVKNAARIYAQCRIENIAELSISGHNVQTLKFGLYGSPASKINGTSRESKTSFIYLTLRFNIEIHCLLKRRLESIEDADCQPYRSREVTMWALDSGGTWRNNHTNKDFQQVLYTSFIEAQNHSKVQHLSWQCYPFS